MKKRTMARIGMLLGIVLLAGGAGVVVWASDKPAWTNDPGAMITKHEEGMSREEIQAELDRQVEENMMTVSVAPQPVFAEGKLHVNVINDETNTFPQRFEVIQGERVVYRSGAIKPGETIESCDVDRVEEGEAFIQIQALDAKTKKDHGNPARVKVNVVLKRDTAE